VDFDRALKFLDEHTSLDGHRGDRFSLDAGTTGKTRVAMDLPEAGQTDGLSLDPMRKLLDALGQPQNAYRTVHITGTNGKGSTARYLSSLLKASGLSVATYTSPNIERINERLCWDGEPISDEEFGRVIGLLAAVEPLIDVTPSRFELLTAAAFVWFADLGADVAVIEVGMLGRFDATNVIDADVAVITNVGKDHTSGGEGWRELVASEKAGIIKPSSHLVLGFDPGELGPIFAAENPRATWVAGTDFRVDANNLAVGGRLADITTPHGNHDEIFVPFHGAHQAQNFANALASYEAFFDRKAEQDVIASALDDVSLPGRFEVVGTRPTVILDGAHNPDGARSAYRTLVDEFARMGSWVLVVGLVGNKDPVEMLEAFNASSFDAVICCEPDWSRRVSADRVAAAADKLGIVAEVVKDPVVALERALAVTAEEDLILVGGSIYVIGEIKSELRR